MVRCCFSSWVSGLSATSAAAVKPLFRSFRLIVLVVSVIMPSRNFRTSVLRRRRARGCPNWISQLSAVGPWFRCKRQCACLFSPFDFRIVLSFLRGVAAGAPVIICSDFAFFWCFSRVHMAPWCGQNDKVFRRPGTTPFTTRHSRATPRTMPGMQARWYQVALCERAALCHLHDSGGSPIVEAAAAADARPSGLKGVRRHRQPFPNSNAPYSLPWTWMIPPSSQQEPPNPPYDDFGETRSQSFQCQPPFRLPIPSHLNRSQRWRHHPPSWRHPHAERH